MSNWKIGQKLVCVNNECDCPFMKMPSIGEIVTISGWSTYFKGAIHLREYPVGSNGRVNAYWSIHFRPIQGEPAKAELLNSFREVVESPDCPINVPQTETS